MMTLIFHVFGFHFDDVDAPFCVIPTCQHPGRAKVSGKKDHMKTHKELFKDVNSPASLFKWERTVTTRIRSNLETKLNGWQLGDAKGDYAAKRNRRK